MEPIAIDGATRLYGIIGDPIVQVRSPQVFSARFRAAGINAVLVPLQIKPQAFDTAMQGLKALANLDGLVITVPYKARVLAHVDRVAPTGAMIGAINAMRRNDDGTWSGDHFDGRGLVRGIEMQGRNVAGRRVMLIGAGGAGSAIAFALAEAGAAAVTIHDIDGAKADALAGRVAAAYPGCAVRAGSLAVEDADLLINASSAGMAPDARLPGPLGTLSPTLDVVDIVTKPEVTPLLRHAEACGCWTMGGRSMLEGQLEAFMRFFGLA